MRLHHGCSALLVVLACAVSIHCQEPAGPPPADVPPPDPPTEEPVRQLEANMGGLGGLYLLASPGKLVVDIAKRDRNRHGRRTDLRVILVGPDRRVIQEETIPDDGQPRGSGLGPLGRVRLATYVSRPGVYAVNITASQDRYGEEILWGFTTNCPKYLIETARGHRDERHQEPIVFASEKQDGYICFLRRPGPFEIEVAGLPNAVKAVTMYDERGRLVESIPVDSQGRATHAFAATESPAPVLWRLFLPGGQATVHIDGVTRWDSTDLYPDLCCWTNSPDAFFPLLDYRWLLTPYSRVVYSGDELHGKISFRLHNNSPRRQPFRVDVEFPGEQWPALTTPMPVVLDGKAEESVEVEYAIGAAANKGPQICHVRATPMLQPEFTTYATLEVRTGESPAAKPVAMPLVLKPYQHENEQFGHLPAYPVENQIYFDVKNRPALHTSDGIVRFRDKSGFPGPNGLSVESATAGAAPTRYRPASTKLAFGLDDGVFALGKSGQQAALLDCDSGGSIRSAYPIPGREGQPRSFDFEEFTGHNHPQGPPPILRYTRTAADAKLFWRRLHDLELFLPKFVDAKLVMGPPILISRKCIGLASHSGIPSSVVSRGDQVHVVWAEATEPEEKVPGVPTYVVSYNRTTEQLGKPALVGYGAPPNDIHNTPSITVDGRGFLHVLAGTHGRPFQYARSLVRNDASGGWTEAEPVGADLRQTYIGMVCGTDGTLHLVYRLWRYNQQPHPASHHATLAYQRKPVSGPWEQPKILVVPPFSEYSVFYHRLTIDRQGRLFLSYDYWSTLWFYRNDHRGSRRNLLMSPDGGQTWRFPQQEDFVEGVRPTTGIDEINP